MTATVIRLADRSIIHRDRALAAHQAELLLAPYRFGWAPWFTFVDLWCAAVASAWRAR